MVGRISLEDFARAPRNHDGIFTSGVATANQITSLVGQNVAGRPEFLRDFWSGPILVSDNIREHVGEAKNGPDRGLQSTTVTIVELTKPTCPPWQTPALSHGQWPSITCIFQ